MRAMTDDTSLNQLLAAHIKLPHILPAMHMHMCSGINVLDNKTEYCKEMERRKQRQQRREDDQRHRENRSTFDIRLEQQANKLHAVG